VDADDRLRLDYEQTTQLLRTLIDVRFRLPAFVPTMSGVAVAFVGRPRPSAELLGVGILGLLATAGIFVYELRNTQISGVLIPRATELEKRLQLPSETKGSDEGGLYAEWPGINVQLLGVLPVSHGLGLALCTRPRSPAGPTSSPWGGLLALEVPVAQATGAAASR
jgi:hypothetical protein